MTNTIGLIGILLAIFVGLVLIYNGFVAKRNIVRESFSGIDVMLKKRFDLIPNLVDTVKVYMTHEKSTLTEIVELRNEAINSSDGKERVKFDASLTKKVNKILAVVENYPDLKSSNNFLQVQEELVAVETDIERSKRYYNGAVRDYNTAIESFPGVLMAKPLGFHVEDFLELADESERNTPEINM